MLSDGGLPGVQHSSSDQQRVFPCDAHLDIRLESESLVGLRLLIGVGALEVSSSDEIESLEPGSGLCLVAVDDDGIGCMATGMSLAVGCSLCSRVWNGFKGVR